MRRLAPLVSVPVVALGLCGTAAAAKTPTYRVVLQGSYSYSGESTFQYDRDECGATAREKVTYHGSFIGRGTSARASKGGIKFDADPIRVDLTQDSTDQIHWDAEPDDPESECSPDDFQALPCDAFDTLTTAEISLLQDTGVKPGPNGLEDAVQDQPGRITLLGTAQPDTEDCFPAMLYPQRPVDGGTYLPRSFIPASSGKVQDALSHLRDGKEKALITGRRSAFEGGFSGDRFTGFDGTWTTGWEVSWSLAFKRQGK